MQSSVTQDWCRWDGASASVWTRQSLLNQNTKVHVTVINKNNMDSPDCAAKFSGLDKFIDHIKLGQVQHVWLRNLC